MIRSLAAVLIFTAACGSKQPAPTPEPEPEASECDGPIDDVESCECAGGMVRGDIGDGLIECAEGELELGRIQYGIEGGVCCSSADPAGE